MKKLLLFGLTGLLGVMFLISAYFKFETIDIFELDLVNTGLLGWSIAPYFARTIIAIELFLGIILVFQFKLKEFAFPFSIGLLLIFTLYLTAELILNGNSGNCNCFGTVLLLTPLESIIKNIVLLGILFYLLRRHPGVTWRFQTLIWTVTLLVSFSLTYFLNPVGLEESASDQKQPTNYYLNLDRIYSDSAIIKPQTDLRKGKHILACLSMSCKHCFIAAYKLHLIKKRNPAIPIYFFVNGKPKDIYPFLKSTQAYNIPQTLVLGKNFLSVTGHEIPTIFYLDDSKVVRKVNYYQLDIGEIEKWLQE